jgi:hypothetical protein
MAYEATHFLKNKKRGGECYVAVKTDMSKAYDRVKWKILRQMMMTMGFNRSWVDVLMCYVTTLSYRINVIEQATEKFIPTRGLCQGDTLLPFLFVICAKV